MRVLEGTFPEITDAGLNHWALIRNGDVLAMDEYLDGPDWEGDARWRDSFLPGALDRYSQDGKTYGIPLSYSVYTCWYNRRMFLDNNWPKPRTWREFFGLCDQIKAKGIAPLAFQGRYPSYAQMIINAAYYHLAGRDAFYDQQALKPGSFDNPELVRAFELAQSLAQKHFQVGAMGMSHTQAQEQFFRGKAAMIFCGSWLKSEMQGKIPDDFRMGTFNISIVENTKADPTAVAITLS